MPPGKFSRHLFCETVVDAEGRLFLGERSRYLYRELADNRFHRVVQGDSIFHLAALYFEGIENPANLYWVIADFQPTPIHDVTLPLDVGRLLIIPSIRTVLEEVMSATRAATDAA